ncbi:MAG: hypothetical protein AB7T49_11605 [Oligoflexales bacterium]
MRKVLEQLSQMIRKWFEDKPVPGTPKMLTDQEIEEARIRLNEAYEKAKRTPSSSTERKVSPKFIGNIGFPDD